MVLALVLVLVLISVIFTVRLVGPHSPESGRVEVYHNGVWGTVCDDDWDEKDGHVVCRMLGYRTAIQVKSAATYGQGTGPIWLSKLNCNGEESSLINCRSSAWGVNNCRHSQDAGVTCSNGTTQGRKTTVSLLSIKLDCLEHSSRNPASWREKHVLI